MQLKLRPNGSPITVQDITKFEAEINASLPDDYKQFMLQYNGGFPTPDYWCIDAIWQKPVDYLTEQLGQRIAIITLYNLNNGHEQSVQRWTESLDDRIPPNSIAIADSGSPVFLMMLAGEKRGSVYLWLPDTEINHDQTNPEQLGFVAASFTEFMDKLYFVAKDS